MKPRSSELSIGKPAFHFFQALKVIFLSVFIILFLNVTFTLYTNVSTRYYTYPHPPFLRISSSSTFSFSSTSFFSSSSSDHLYSNSPPSPALNPSSTSPPLSHPPSASHSNSLPNNPPPVKSVQNFSTAPFPPANSSSEFDTVKRKQKGLVKGCDLSKGEWIEDPNAPYYTNTTCWTIQEHQNCMKYGRPNLDFLKWRWKPDGCELPLLEPAEFLEFMRGKNLAFIGDSLARNQMQSLMCLLSRVEYPEERWPPADNLTEMLYRSYNFTIYAFWSPFLIRAALTKLKSNRYDLWSLHLDEPDPLWQAQLARFDHIVINTGNWYNRPAQFLLKRKPVGCHYCLLKNTPFMSVHKAHRRAFRTALDAIVGNRGGFRGVAVVRTVSPSHFEGGEWNGGGDCRRTRPFRRGGARLKGMDLELYRDQMREFWKAKWEGSERGVELRLLDTTAAMVVRGDGHPSRYGHWAEEERVMYNDCVHWCLPGPVDMWNDLLFQVLRV